MFSLQQTTTSMTQFGEAEKFTVKVDKINKHYWELGYQKGRFCLMKLNRKKDVYVLQLGYCMFVTERF